MLTKQNELNEFIKNADDLLSSKYILSEIRITAMLKSIASSETLMAIFKSSLDGFDYENAKSKYLIKNQYLADTKGEFVQPTTLKDLLAFILNILYDIDAKNIVLSDFLSKYFYSNGSCFEQYNAFLHQMIKPFKIAVVEIMDKVLSGQIEDPIAFISREEEKKVKDDINAKKSYGESIKKLKEILFIDKKKIKESKLDDGQKEEMTLIIDMLANASEGQDKDGLIYAYVSYKYLTKSKKLMFFGREKKVGKLVGDIFSGI